MQECWICKRPLSSWFTTPSDESWHSTNVAPHAASGGTMVGVHDKCIVSADGGLAPSETTIAKTEQPKIIKLRLLKETNKCR